MGGILRASGLRRAAFAGLATAMLAVPAQARADERVIAAPFSAGYLNPNVSIDSGEALTFFNPDFSAPHDVTSADPGLFRSETVSAPAEVPVVGAESLAPGSYRFICSVHTYMEGTLTVGAGAGGGGGADGKGPGLSARVLDDRIAEVLDAGALRLRVKLDEPATVRAVATAGRRSTEVAKGRAKLDAGTAKLAARLTGRGKRLLRHADKVRLELALSAKDAAGNARKDAASATLR
jgi:plastocyanin